MPSPGELSSINAMPPGLQIDIKLKCVASLISTYCVEGVGMRLTMSADSNWGDMSSVGTPLAITSAGTGSAARLARVKPRDRPRSSDTTAVMRQLRVFGAVAAEQVGVEACTGDFHHGPAAEGVAHRSNPVMCDRAKLLRLSQDRVDSAAQVGRAQPQLRGALRVAVFGGGAGVIDRGHERGNATMKNG